MWSTDSVSRNVPFALRFVSVARIQICVPPTPEGRTEFWRPLSSPAFVTVSIGLQGPLVVVLHSKTMSSDSLLNVWFASKKNRYASPPEGIVADCHLCSSRLVVPLDSTTSPPTRQPQMFFRFRSTSCP